MNVCDKYAQNSCNDPNDMKLQVQECKLLEYYK